MPTLEVITDALLIAQAAISLGQTAILVWVITGGWKFLLRSIGFFLDCMLAKLIGTIYGYFETLITQDLFNETVVDALSRNIYVFIGVLVFFRLMMILIKYLVNPDLVSDAKVGVNSLIKRVIIGMCGILFLPTIFDLAMGIQKAVFQDNLIQQIIIPSDYLDNMNEIKEDGGKYIGTYVLAGFVSPNEKSTIVAEKIYQAALKSGDFSLLTTVMNANAFMSDEYAFDYFFIISTFTLCYVLYLMIKYCLDLATRSFKLLLYQILAPVAMVEYMVNGADDGVFKNWRSAVISTYFLLFVRVLALWFVLFVLSLMITPDGTYTANSLLANDDYFLRAMIIVALLGFMMDLPKLVGQVFGLDLEQEGSATGLMKQIGGMVKGAAIGGLAIGGATLGGLASGGIGLAKLGSKMGENKRNAAAQGKSLNFGQNLMSSAKQTGMFDRLAEGGAATRKSVFGANQFTGALYGGASGVVSAGAGGAKQGKSSYDSKEDKKEAQERQAFEDQREANGSLRRTAERLADSQSFSSKDEFRDAMVQQRFGDSAKMTAEITGELSRIIASNGGKELSSDEIVQTVKRKWEEQTGTHPPGEVEQVVKQVIQKAVESGTDFGDLTQVATVVSTSVSSLKAEEMPAVEQVVNQVYGTKVGGETLSAVQEVSQKLSTTIDIQKDIRTNTEETAVWTELGAEMGERTANASEQQVTIQRNIQTNVEDIHVFNDLTAENTERAANTLENINRNNNGNSNN